MENVSKTTLGRGMVVSSTATGAECLESLSRRTFVKGSALAVAASAAASVVGGLFGAVPAVADERQGDSTQAVANEVPEEGEIKWGYCSCGFATDPIKFHVVDGVARWVECVTGDEEFGSIGCRSCARARIQRRILNHPDRLKYPMKRVEGTKRGDGEYERISWDEAIDIIAENFQRVNEQYGGHGIFPLASSSRSDAFTRFCNMNNGYLNMYSADSYGEIHTMMGFMMGKGLDQISTGSDPDIAGECGSHLTVLEDSDIALIFGDSAGESRPGGGGATYDYAIARENGTKFYFVDYRLGETNAAHPEEWVPIRPGTDAALASAINYVLIDEGFADEEFLHSHTVGYDEETMPEEAKGQNLSYKDYIMGTGYDNVPKTPEWASPICLVPVEKIYEIARAVGNAKAAFIGQGWGPQRHHNGEYAAASIVMIAIISGHYGLPGTNNGLKAPSVTGGMYPSGPWVGIPSGQNPITSYIPCGARVKVIAEGENMTATKDGVRGIDKLPCSPKFVTLFGTGMVATSTNDSNWSTSILADENNAEFVLASEIFLSPTAVYADLILPDTYRYEATYSFSPTQSAGRFHGYVWGTQVQAPQFECRSQWDWVCDLADRFGMKEQFTEGKTWEEWMEERYQAQVVDRTAAGFAVGVGEVDANMEEVPEYPVLEEGIKAGYMLFPAKKRVAGEKWRQDPEAHPMQTPSGKFEIYSTRLAELAETWEFDDPRDYISPIPIYMVEAEGYTEATEEFPLQICNHKPIARSHSCPNNVDVLNQAFRRQLWINPIDAEPRGIQSGDQVQVRSAHGAIQIEANVTPRVIPGTCCLPHGNWRKLDENGVDIGGGSNSITGHHFSPIGKMSPAAGGVLAQVTKVS